jgi:16S rRNA (adenine1518-N6/adenine1519-N6)-dimethyltransferase
LLKNVSNSTLDTLPSLQAVINTHDLRAKKSLGQNFLLDLNLTARIVATAPIKSDNTVIEVGPGPGGLTRALIGTQARQVVAIEFDPRAVAALQDLVRVSNGRLIVRPGDALALDWAELLIPLTPTMIIANLPYNIATPLLLGWLRIIRDQPGLITHLSLMFQREVADRLTAAPGTKDYGRLSVMTQWLVVPTSVMTLPPTVFVPPPKVHSSVVAFTPRVLDRDAPTFIMMEQVVARAFGHRRKMLRSICPDWVLVLETLNIDPTRRAETLSVDDFIRLANALSLKET